MLHAWTTYKDLVPDANAKHRTQATFQLIEEPQSISKLMCLNVDASSAVSAKWLSGVVGAGAWHDLLLRGLSSQLTNAHMLLCSE